MSASRDGRVSPSSDFDDACSLDKLQVEDPLDCEVEGLSSTSLHPKPAWKRIFDAVAPGPSANKEPGGWLPLRSSNVVPPNSAQGKSWRTKFSYCLLLPTLSFFVML